MLRYPLIDGAHKLAEDYICAFSTSQEITSAATSSANLARGVSLDGAGCHMLHSMVYAQICSLGKSCCNRLGTVTLRLV